MAVPQFVEQFVGESIIVPVTLTEDVTGWLVGYTLKDSAGTIVAEKDTTDGITAPTIKTLHIDLSDGTSQGLGVGSYTWSVWRTNAAAENVIALGYHVVKPLL